LEARRRLGILPPIGDKVRQFAVHVLDQVPAQDVEIDVARPHHRCRILVIDEGQKQMLQGCVFVTALAGKSEGSMKGLFKTT